jgi:hypothetical protein
MARCWGLKVPIAGGRQWKRIAIHNSYHCLGIRRRARVSNNNNNNKVRERMPGKKDWI